MNWEALLQAALCTLIVWVWWNQMPLRRRR